jgi:hypothetical protein
MALSPTDQCIVLPFRAGTAQPFNGTGLALHFLVGNVLVLHTGLKEMWFGWRVKKIFPGKGVVSALLSRCGQPTGPGSGQPVAEGALLALRQLRTRQPSSFIFSTDNAGSRHPPVDLAITLDDGLIGFRTQLIQWLDSLGRPMPDDQVRHPCGPKRSAAKAWTLWVVHWSFFTCTRPMAATDRWRCRHLKRRQRRRNLSWLRIYTAGRFTATGTIRPHGVAFLTSLRINPAGAGAMSGMMWCGVYDKDLEEALFWSGRKADVCRQDVQAAREAGRRRYAKVNP